VDAATGTIKTRVAIPEAKFLNDVACDGAKVYVSDMMGNKIYMVADGKASVAAEGDLEFPNGLLVDGTRLIIGGWGSQPKADFTTDVPGHIFAYDMATKKKTLITKKPIGNIDGLESDGAGGYLATDNLKGTLLHVAPNGDFKVLRQLKAGAADIGFATTAKILLVPQMGDSQVVAYDLTADLK
jgi:sugar lactone lactonase YvrE